MRIRRGVGRRGGPLWMPRTPAVGLSADQERDLAGEDLQELLAATNAKRRARGMPEQSADDVELRIFFEQQQGRRGTGET